MLKHFIPLVHNNGTTSHIDKYSIRSVSIAKSSYRDNNTATLYIYFNNLGSETCLSCIGLNEDLTKFVEELYK